MYNETFVGLFGAYECINAKTFKLKSGPFSTLKEANKAASKLFESYASSKDFDQSQGFNNSEDPFEKFGVGNYGGWSVTVYATEMDLHDLKINDLRKLAKKHNLNEKLGKKELLKELHPIYEKLKKEKKEKESLKRKREDEEGKEENDVKKKK
jgi:hypothetical protein